MGLGQIAKVRCAIIFLALASLSLPQDAPRPTNTVVQCIDTDVLRLAKGLFCYASLRSLREPDDRCHLHIVDESFFLWRAAASLSKAWGTDEHELEYMANAIADETASRIRALVCEKRHAGLYSSVVVGLCACVFVGSSSFACVWFYFWQALEMHVSSR